MGVIDLFNSSSFDSSEDSKDNKISISNSIPDPKKYRILREKRINDFLIIKINYTDCINYEGNKILVFKNCKILDLVQQEHGIDPHFSENEKLLSPVARFRPDEEGWKMAESFVVNFK